MNTPTIHLLMKEMSIEMICPKCKELEQKSQIHGGNGFSTAMYCPSYYDEDGKYHNHDSNSRSYEYRCSMGHQIFVSPSNRCSSCDFGHDETITVKDLAPITNVVTMSADGLSGTISWSSGTGFVESNKLNKGE